MPELLERWQFVSAGVALERECRQRRGWELLSQPLDVSAATGEAPRKLWANPASDF